MYLSFIFEANDLFRSKPNPFLWTKKLVDFIFIAWRHFLKVSRDIYESVLWEQVIGPDDESWWRNSNSKLKSFELLFLLDLSNTNFGIVRNLFKCFEFILT